jgi:hypothetical protein
MTKTNDESISLSKGVSKFVSGHNVTISLKWFNWVGNHFTFSAGPTERDPALFMLIQTAGRL